MVEELPMGWYNGALTSWEKSTFHKERRVGRGAKLQSNFED